MGHALRLGQHDSTDQAAGIRAVSTSLKPEQRGTPSEMFGGHDRNRAVDVTRRTRGIDVQL